MVAAALRAAASTPAAPAAAYRAVTAVVDRSTVDSATETVCAWRVATAACHGPVRARAASVRAMTTAAAACSIARSARHAEARARIEETMTNCADRLRGGPASLASRACTLLAGTSW